MARNDYPQGFTQTPAVQAILKPLLLKPDSLDPTVTPFSGLTPEAAKKLLALLPPEHAEVSENYAPTFAQMVALGEQFPGIEFFGYWVSPEREDERISIEGFVAPEALALALHAALIDLEQHEDYCELPGEWNWLSPREGQVRARW